MINSIFRRPTAAGLSKNSRKAYAREVMHIIGEAPKRARIGVTMSFDDSDLEGVKFPHDYPLVITPIIGNSPVRRVLVDNGALVDILLHDTFLRMGYNDSQLTPTDMPIYGFAGVEYPVEGIIKLPTTIGQEPRQATQMLNFVVVKASSTYNAIMGRTGIHAFKAVPSSYHSVMKWSWGQVLPIEDLDIRENDEKRGKPAEYLVSIPLAPEDPGKVTFIGATLKEPLRGKLVRFLQENSDVFAWSAANMPGIYLELITHKLNVDPNRKTEVEKLLEAGFIEEIQFPEWLANPVMVKKANGKWRRCVDFTDLNDACPKDCFPLPKIDTLIDATAGHEMLSFMDGFSGYNQIKMHKDDIPKVSSITDFGVYCYLVMAFGLKNAGATNQREALEVLRYHKMMLNPTKCAFGVESGNFLGLMVSKRGIEADPDKIKAILDMEPQKTIKDVQKLTRRVVALGRFISKSGDKCLSFFKSLKNIKDFVWSEENQKAFEELKKYMAKILHGAELNYSTIEKFALALVMASRKLRPYFQAQQIEFDLKYKPRTAIKAPALADFVVECTIPNQEVGGQEDNIPQDKEVDKGDKEKVNKKKEYRVLYFDGASKTNSSGAGLVLQSPDGFLIEYAMKLDFPTTNNEAEYEALIASIGLAGTLRVKNLKVCGDSKLVISQVKGEFEARDETMAKYVRLVRAVMTQFDECHVKHIPREENSKADGSVYYRVLKIWSIDVKLVAPIGLGTSWIDPNKAHIQTDWPDEARLALEEVHEGICGQHLGGRAMAHFYWPEMMADAKEYVKKCDRCQKHAPVVRQPPEMLTSINSPIPFTMWGMDILGPFPMATAQRKFLIVAIDYFTKWIEAKPLAKIITKQVAQFLWENIMCRYGITRILVTDNGTQFNNEEFKKYCEENEIELRFTSVAHPQANGQVEVANRIILDGLKKRIEKIQAFNAEDNEEGQRLALDLIDEVRDEAHAKIVEYQKKAWFYYNLRVKERFFKQGDLVLRKVEASGVGQKGKLAPNWEGPYKVKSVQGRGTYKLETMDGFEVPRTWHAQNLKVYYV
ncbi:hypothetical protein AgCh_038254 [Apium graveolens]